VSVTKVYRGQLLDNEGVVQTDQNVVLGKWISHFEQLYRFCFSIKYLRLYFRLSLSKDFLSEQ
jgi:hypothetical protein